MKLLKAKLASSVSQRRISSNSPTCSLLKRKVPRKALGIVQLSPANADEKYAAYCCRACMLTDLWCPLEARAQHQKELIVVLVPGAGSCRTSSMVGW